jgi:hypothetical protein
VARGCRLSDRDAEDVAQTVWLRLLENLDRIREPDALPGWISTTAGHESVRLARRQGREAPLDLLDEHLQPGTDHAEVDDLLLRAERDRAVRDGPAAPRSSTTGSSASPGRRASSPPTAPALPSPPPPKSWSRSAWPGATSPTARPRG